MTRHILIPALLTALFCAVGGCQIHPRPTEIGGDALPPAPTPDLPYHVSDMRIQSVRPMPYLYSSTRTSFEDIAQPASQTVPVLQRLSASGQAKAAGPILFVYHDPSENPAAPFDLEIGLPVRDVPASLPEGFHTRTLPPFRCATLIYRGPMTLLSKAYDKLIPKMIAAGLIPSEETRESYIVWDSPDSPRNVVQIEVGIQ